MQLQQKPGSTTHIDMTNKDCLDGRRAEMASSQRSPVSKVHLCSSDQRFAPMCGEDSCIRRPSVLQVFSISRILFIRKHKANCMNQSMGMTSKFVSDGQAGELDASKITRKTWQTETRRVTLAVLVAAPLL